MNPLIADNLRHDPRVLEARRMLLDAVESHQASLTGPRPADPARRASYQETLERFGHLRGGGLYFPYLGSGIGRGALVELADGSVKYDMISGIGVHHFGHSHPGLVAHAVDAALADTIMQGNLQQGTNTPLLMETLVTLASRRGAKLEHCFLATSGAMANENALKLVFQKKSPASRVLAFERAFMGRTLALSQITDSPKYRAGLPAVLSVDYVPFFDAARPEASLAEALAVVERHLSRYPGQHAAMCVELVQGEGGYYPGDAAFFRTLFTLLRKHGIAIIADEVQTFGRTSEPFAFQHYKLDDLIDVVTIGKLSQVCATLFTAAFRPQPGLISQTFTGSSASIIAARAMIEALDHIGAFGGNGKNMLTHAAFVRRFEAIAQRHPAWLSGPFGIGGMIAFTPFDGSAEKARDTVHAMFDAGVIGFVAGSDPSRVRFLPPVPVLSDSDIEAVCRIIEEALEAVASRPSAGPPSPAAT